MRPEPLIIRLAGQDFTIRPFTIEQHLAMNKVVKAYDAEDPDKTDIAALQVALLRDYPELSRDGAQVEADSVAEFRTAVHAIFVFAGFLKDDKKGNPTPGEAPAAEISTG